MNKKTNNISKDNNKNKQEKTLFKSFSVNHKTNNHKLNPLFDLYSVYKAEFKQLIHSHWFNFTHNQYHLISSNLNDFFNVNSHDNLATFNNILPYKHFKFSHLGSTKHIHTQLNASYLQACLQQVCASLNGYLSTIQNRFNQIINKSSFNYFNNDYNSSYYEDFLHQLRSINYHKAWLYKSPVYFPLIRIIDDFGNLITTEHNKPAFVSKQALNIAKKIFKNIVNHKISFPSTHKPKLVLDTRTCEIQPNHSSKEFDYWLNISTLVKGKPVLIPIKTNDYFNHSIGLLGNTVELNFNYFDYMVKQHKHDSLNNSKQHNKFIYNDRELKITLNKKYTFNEQLIHLGLDNQHNNKEYLKNKVDIVGFDLGLCTLIATSKGELLGRNWLNKLKVYDNKITSLSTARQKLGLKVRSKRYDLLVKQVRGFIKSEINRILNQYINSNHSKLKKIIVEKLNFNNPDLSRRLNRIIKNFGQKIFKDKLEELCKIYQVELEEVNPAYTSQECNDCGYVDEKNRKTQDKFNCLCCGNKEHADSNGSKAIVGRSNETIKGLLKDCKTRLQVLNKLKEVFEFKIPTLVIRGKVSRRRLYEVLNSNKYYSIEEIKAIVKTTEGQGVVPAVN